MHRINILMMMNFQRIVILGIFSCILHFSLSKNIIMSRNCGKEVKIDGVKSHYGNVRQTTASSYASNTNCKVVFHTHPSFKFIIVFKRLDIEYEPMCDDDHLQLFDGNSTKAPHVKNLPSRICGTARPKGSYATDGNYLLIKFHSDSYEVEDGFEIILTTFREEPCRDGEYKCINGRCISELLVCDGTNNCGDYSDECQWTPGVVVAIIGAVVFVTLFGIGAVSYIRKQRKTSAYSKKKEKELGFAEEIKKPQLIRTMSSIECEKAMNAVWELPQETDTMPQTEDEQQQIAYAASNRHHSDSDLFKTGGSQMMVNPEMFFCIECKNEAMCHGHLDGECRLGKSRDNHNSRSVFF